MTDDAMNPIPAFSRVSIRAVLVHEGEDPHTALAAAGLIDPVAIPVVVGDDPGLFGGILGNAISPNLTAVLETEQPGDAGNSPTGSRPGTTATALVAAQPSGPVTATMPAAYAMQPLAPVRRYRPT